MSKPVAYIGCDPGTKGYYCLLVPSTKMVDFFLNDAKPRDIAMWLHTRKNQYDIPIVMIEDVHSLFGMSAKSNFSFGRNVEKVNVIPQVVGLSVDLVKPKIWQKQVGVSIPATIKGKARTKAIKQAVASICDRLYPGVPIRGPQGGLQDGKSDSLMIAHYASQTFKI